MVIQASDGVVVRRRVEYLSDLLQKTFSVQLGGAHESILPQQDVLSFQGSVEATELLGG